MTQRQAAPSGSHASETVSQAIAGAIITLKVQGIPFSVHTRKAIITARYIQLALEIDPLVPLTQPEAWSTTSPLRKIPVLFDGDLVINDSSVICAYLDRRFPDPSIYPAERGVSLRLTLGSPAAAMATLDEAVVEMQFPIITRILDV